MLFLALAKVRSGTRTERTARRLQYEFPEGLRLVAEYWLQHTDPNVIVVAEADDIAPVMAAVAVWDDVYSFTVVPAVTAEQGSELVRANAQKRRDSSRRQSQDRLRAITSRVLPSRWVL